MHCEFPGLAWFYDSNQAMNAAYEKYSDQRNAAFNRQHPIDLSPRVTTPRVN